MKWWLVALAMALGPSLAAAAPATLTVTMRLAEAEWQVIRQEVLPPFERSCGCRARAIDVPPETLTQRLKAMQAAGRMEIDLFSQDNMRLLELVEAGLVQPLEETEVRMEPAVLPALAAAGVIGGRRYFVPFRPNVQIAYYNAKKFDAYGLTPPRSWEELLRIAKAFKEKEGIGRVLFKGVGGAPTTTQLYEWIVSAGGDPFDFSHPGTVATFRFLQELAPFLSPDSRRAKWDTTNDALAQEVAYLAQNWPFGVPLLVRDYGKREIRTYSGWAGPEREAHVIGGDVLGIPAGAPNRELALRLIRHLQSRGVQEILASRLGWPTIRADAAGAVEPWLRPHVAAVQEAMRHGVFRANVPYWAEYERIASEAVDRILWRNGKVAEVLPPLAARLSALRKGER
ncbi:MAG: ABC transporter substrate-binding protein [Candidatus Methylomirabilota bacterium]